MGKVNTDEALLQWKMLHLVTLQELDSILYKGQSIASLPSYPKKECLNDLYSETVVIEKSFQ